MLNVNANEPSRRETVVDVSVVIPVYNEVESVEPLVREIFDVLVGLSKSYEVLLIDDGSKDGSWEKLITLRTEFPQLGLIRFRRNFGQTAALSAGFQHSCGEVIVTLDADLQNDPADIPRLLERVEQGFDVVSGWRKNRQDRALDRRLPSIMANLLIRKITGVLLHDFGCTLKAYRRDVIRDVHLYGEMHRFIPALAAWVGGKVDEVVVNHRARRYGLSKYGISRTITVILDLITVRFLLRYSTGPIQLFGKLAAIFAVPGFLMLLSMVIANVSFHFFGTTVGADLIKRPFWVMTSFMLLFMGMQLVSMGLLAEVQIRTYHESQDKPTYVVQEKFDPAV